MDFIMLAPGLYVLFIIVLLVAIVIFYKPRVNKFKSFIKGGYTGDDYGNKPKPKEIYYYEGYSRGLKIGGTCGVIGCLIGQIISYLIF